MVSIASAAFSLCRPSEFSTSVLTLIHLGQNTTKERRSHKKVSLSVPISTFADVISRVQVLHVGCTRQLLIFVGCVHISLAIGWSQGQGGVIRDRNVEIALTRRTAEGQGMTWEIWMSRWTYPKSTLSTQCLHLPSTLWSVITYGKFVWNQCSSWFSLK